MSRRGPHSSKDERGRKKTKQKTGRLTLKGTRTCRASRRGLSDVAGVVSRSGRVASWDAGSGVAIDWTAATVIITMATALVRHAVIICPR